MKIREIRKSDLDSLRNIFLKERQTTFSWVDSATYSLQDFDIETKGECILTAISDNIAIGFISVWAEDNFIHHLYVEQKYHGKGIGTQLLKAVLNRSDFPVTLKCLENNTGDRKASLLVATEIRGNIRQLGAGKGMANR